MDDNIIDVKKYKLKDFFINNMLYIPKYQRDYAWKENNINQLMDDLNKHDGYYLGNVMISNVTNNGYIEMIDGQQRIITVFLILCAIKNCNYKDEVEKFFDKNILLSNEELRINLDDRISDEYCKVFKYIFYNSLINKNFNNINEYVQYNKIIKNINKNYSLEKVKSLYNKIISCYILVIKSTDKSLTPYDIFLNLNTKGLKLTDDDIIKSKIFSYLQESKDFDAYKNSWFNVVNLIKKENMDSYLSAYLTLYKNESNKKNKKTIVDKFLDIIVDESSAKEVYNTIGNQESIFFKTYIAVVNNDFYSYQNEFINEAINIKAIFNLLSYNNKNKFKQFNITFISILLFKDDQEKRVIRENYHNILSFIKLLLLYQLYRSAQNLSPSLYANNFIQLAVDIKNNKKQMMEKIKLKINTLSIEKLEDKNVEAIFTNMKCEGNSKYSRIACSLIALIDGCWPMADFFIEHYICQSSSNPKSFNFGNLIPVKKDDYKDYAQEEKIKKYNDVKMTEGSINIFLNDLNKSDKNSVVDFRTKKYIKQYTNIFNELLIGLKGDKNDN